MFLSRINKLFFRLKSVKGEVLWVTVGQFLVLLGGFATIKLLTTIMGPEEYGKLALGLTISSFINMLLYGPLGQVVIRFFSIYKERGLLNNYLLILSKAYFYLSFALIILLIVGTIILNQFIGNQWVLITILSSLFAIINGLNVSFNSLQDAIRQRKIVALHQSGDIWLRLLFAVIIMFIFKENAYYAFIGYILSSILITLSQKRFILKNSLIKDKLKVGLSKDSVKQDIQEFYSYALPFVLWSILLSISMYSDRWILQNLFGPAEVGIYVAIYQIARVPVNGIIQTVNKFMMPVIFETAGDLSIKENINKSVRLLYLTVLSCGAIFLPIIIFSYLLGDTIINTLTTKEFSQYSKLLWLLLLSQCIFYLTQTLANVAQIVKQPQKHIISFLLNAISMVVFGLSFGQEYGVFGVALGLITSSVVYFITVLIINRKLVSKRLSH